MNVNPKKASVAVGVEEHLLGGRDHIRESVGGLEFQVSANSFFQTNTAQAERLFALVLDSAGLTGGETVLDLYSGTGAISLQLARRCRWVYGVEVTQAAVDDAARNAAANGIANCTFLAGEVRFVLPELDRPGRERAGGRGGSAARGLPPEGAARARCSCARRASSTSRAIRRRWRATWASSCAAAIASSGCSPWTCSRTRRTSRRWRARAPARERAARGMR